MLVLMRKLIRNLMGKPIQILNHLAIRSIAT